MRKHVLTGGPGVGKTTMLQVLAKDYHIVEEAATRIIREELRHDGEALPWKDVDKFQRKVLELQLEMEAKIPEGATAFLDRGIPDGIAYYRVRGAEPPEELLRLAKAARYDKVFLIEPLPFIEHTEVRRDTELAALLHKEQENTYTALGYRIVKVPALKVEDRIEFILKRL